MNTLVTFTKKCTQAYQEMLRKEPYYEAWSNALVLKVNGQVQDAFPLVSLIASTRSKPVELTLSPTELQEYHEKVNNFLFLEEALGKMSIYGSWVSAAGIFSYEDIQILLDLEAMQADPQKYLDDHLNKFPISVHATVRETVNSMSHWGVVLSYL